MHLILQSLTWLLVQLTQQVLCIQVWAVVCGLLAWSLSILAKVDLSAEGVCANLDAVAIFDMRWVVGLGWGFPSCSVSLCFVSWRTTVEDWCCMAAFTVRYSSSQMVVTRSTMSTCQLEVFDEVEFYIYLVPQPLELLLTLFFWIYFNFSYQEMKPVQISKSIETLLL